MTAAATDPAARRRVLRTAVAVGLATAAYGISFGALARLAGLDVAQTAVLSLVMFTGGSQFALIGVLAAGGLASGPSAVASAALLGVRNLFYAVRVAPIVGPGLLRRALGAQLTIDETTAMALAQPVRPLQRLAFWATGIACFAGWNAATLLGVGLGDLLGDVRRYGLDAASAAALLALLWPRLVARQAAAVAAASAVVATAFTPLLAPGIPVLLTVVVAVAVGTTNVLGRRAPAGIGGTA